MIVDDERSVVEGVGIVLRRSRFEVVEAPSGEEGLEALRAGFRGVVLMDIMMPGMTGWETIRAAARENLLEHSLVCMLTARAWPGREGEGLEEHVFDYLPKPFSNSDLVQLVSTAAECLGE